MRSDECVGTDWGLAGAPSPLLYNLATITELAGETVCIHTSPAATLSPASLLKSLVKVDLG